MRRPAPTQQLDAAVRGRALYTRLYDEVKKERDELNARVTEERIKHAQAVATLANVAHALETGTPRSRSFLSPHRPAHLAGRSAAMSLADDLGDLVVAAAATASVAFSLYVTRDVTPPAVSAATSFVAECPTTTQYEISHVGPQRSMQITAKELQNEGQQDLHARRSRHAHRVLARARCRCTPSPSILRGAFDSLYAQTADMLEGLQAQLCHAYRTITGVRYEPLNEMADGIGTSTDAAIQALIELGLPPGHPLGIPPPYSGPGSAHQMDSGIRAFTT